MPLEDNYKWEQLSNNIFIRSPRMANINSEGIKPICQAFIEVQQDVSFACHLTVVADTAEHAEWLEMTLIDEVTDRFKSGKLKVENCARPILI